MATIDRMRLKALESRLGAILPVAFTVTLVDRERIHEGNVALVTHDRIWDVRTTFGLDNGDSADQLDRVYELVGDVLPPGAVPFARDWGGNFYCFMLSGPQAGQVVYWDHERDEGDYRLQTMAETVAGFYARLVPDPRE